MRSFRCEEGIDASLAGFSAKHVRKRKDQSISIALAHSGEPFGRGSISHTLLSRGTDRLVFAGVTDLSAPETGNAPPDIDKALADAPASNAQRFVEQGGTAAMETNHLDGG